MQIVFDFITGKIAFNDFYAIYQADSSIGAWLDRLTDFQVPYPPAIEKETRFRSVYNIMRKKGRKISDYISETLNPPAHKGFDLAAMQSVCFDAVATPVLMAYPDIKPTKFYARNSDYYLNAAGNSIGGREVADYVDQILDQFPPTMKVSERTKAGKEALWNAFHIKDRKFPRWPQGPEWPMGKNSPMEYLSQRRDGELLELRFRDVDTGEIRIVEQFY